jgi:hypothetical protein
LTNSIRKIAGLASASACLFAKLKKSAISRLAKKKLQHSNTFFQFDGHSLLGDSSSLAARLNLSQFGHTSKMTEAIGVEIGAPRGRALPSPSCVAGLRSTHEAGHGEVFIKQRPVEAVAARRKLGTIAFSGSSTG